MTTLYIGGASSYIGDACIGTEADAPAAAAASANVRIITPNDADAATLTASPAAVATLPVTNLQDPTRARLWRSISAVPQTIFGDWADAYSVSGFALVRHNLTPNATLRLKIYDGPGQTGMMLYDSGNTAIGTAIGWGELVWGRDAWGGSNIFSGWAYAFTTLWFSADYARSFSLTITDTANPDGYLQASRLFLGQYFEPLMNFDYGVSLGWEESSKQQRTDGGTLRTDAFDPYRRITFSLSNLGDGERAQLMEIARKVGMRDDLFLSCFPGQGGAKERDYAGQMKAVQVARLSHPRLDRFKTELIFEES